MHSGSFGGRFAVRYSSPHLAPVVRERGLFGSYGLSLDRHAIAAGSKGSLHWLAGSLGRINRVFPTSRPKIKLYYLVNVH